MTIKILPPEVASQIAAGEVVERPASVVKELIENALDAGADQITIQVEEAGKRLIEIADNGNGIPPDELSLAVIRHATSKLSTAEELFRISTLGFRGEALAAIGSVSHLTITSRPREADMGATIHVEGGKSRPPQPVGAPAGTVIRVEDLFYNVPARLKFLKTDRTERGRIDNIVTNYALAYPNVRFKLQHGSRVTFQSSGNGDAREALSAVHGVEIARQMIAVLAEDDTLNVTGFISPPDLTRSNRREILFFVNGRPVSDFTLTKSLTQAYHTLLMVGRYPIAVLFLDMPPQAVDVNVHPTKAEVRFRERGDVFRSVGRAVRRALLAHTPVPSVGGPQGGALWGASSGGSAIPRRIDPAWEMATDAQGQNFPRPTGEAAQSPLPATGTPILRLIGQVATTYLIAEGPDGLYLIDQHAAHERVLFEKFLAAREDTIPSQALLESVTVEFSPAAAGLLEEKLPLLGKLGYEVETFGPNAFVVRAIPAMFAELTPEAALRAVVEDLEVDETPLESRIEEKIIARVCKRAAVKAGQTLSAEEQKALLRDLEACHSPRTCPHGRPTMIHLSVDLLERRFGRTGPR
ncbi:MAG: DNA mismatch repair endonuclease MutL [Chloroflexota bacterium]|nr:DNA mismatch repair endonuclease MutL [Chloroflexota bacterium]